MRINTLSINADFKYIWLKTVEAVDLSQNCARSLIGEYDKRITPGRKTVHGLDLKDSVYYLCGVAQPFRWENNFHLAFRPAPGKSVHYESNGIVVDIADAEQLPIPEDYIDMEHPKAKIKAYRTCRNWQFAHWFKRNLNV
ncbi:MAG: hypothetical protein KHZ05_05380 [Oscillospiraceae bacterium]|nr:hypothetical protein [Oscillospiraceae bacterium]